MQRLVAIRLGHREPVAQALGVGLIHIGNDRIGLPALHLFQLLRTVDDDADGKQIVDALEGALLLLHLLPDGVDRLGAALNVTLDASGLNFLFYRLYEALDIGIASSLCSAKFLADMVVGIVLHILEREVFELALKLIETQLVGQRRIEISRLLRHLHLSLDILSIANLAHQVDTIGNHDENHTHILGKREQQIAEVLALDSRILIVELLDAIKAMKYAGNRLAMSLLDLVEGDVASLDIGYELNGLDSIAFQPDLLSQDFSRLARHAFLLFVCKCKFFCHK